MCSRPVPPGAKSSLHHLVPKLKGGTHMGTVRLQAHGEVAVGIRPAPNQVCHSAIHAHYTEAELARRLHDPAALRAAPEMERFIAWVQTKPDDFHAPTRASRKRTGKWR